eukprot:8696886-Pyramimonas_sp.AAC.1
MRGGGVAIPSNIYHSGEGSFGTRRALARGCATNRMFVLRVRGGAVAPRSNTYYSGEGSFGTKRARMCTERWLLAEDARW